MQTIVVRIARNAVLVALFVAAAVLGAVSGALFVFAGDLPQISALDDYAPNTITRVYARSGDIVGEFATERRIVVTYDRIAEHLRHAIVAAEDESFERHVGLSIPRILIALFKDLVEQRKAAGASTLTQQLARNLFLTPEKTWERKIKEALIAIQIEKRYTKPEVFTLYANQIYLGHGAYGVEAASRLYFGKSASALSVPEAATIAGIIQSPSRQSPYVNMENALRRRNYALTRMATEGYISEAEAEAARKSPIVTVGLPTAPASVAPYFVEEVRKYLEATYGAQQLYENGLGVRTGLDIALQRVATRVLADGLRRVDKRRGWRAPRRNVLTEQQSLDAFAHPRWGRAPEDGDVVPAVVEAVEPARIRVRIGAERADIPRDGFSWTGRSAATQLVKVGDLVEARVKRGDAGKPLTASLEQEPVVEGALLAIENRTGHVLAMVGGYDFERSKFNRAVQAARQLGSTFKPFVYTAAIDRGYTPASMLLDAPVAFSGGAGAPPYAPSNYDNTFQGPITLRRALEQSRNVPAVRLMDALGPRQVIQYARRFGFEGPMPPYLSLALGAAEATLEEVVTAYAVFPNQGVRMKPHAVTRVIDRLGNVLEENRPEPTDAIRADTAYVMTSLLEGVTQRGTAAKAAALNWPVGGKTGTTNDYTDAWFIGFDPDITVGVWVGLDQKKPLGNRETGGVAALPIWIEFMKAWIGDRKDKPEFARPGNVLFVSVDPSTGAETTGEGSPAISEVFISGTQPSAVPRQQDEPPPAAPAPPAPAPQKPSPPGDDRPSRQPQR
jgi:penicillin-binding protein 1A